MEFHIGDRVVCIGRVDGSYDTDCKAGVVIAELGDELVGVEFDTEIPGSHSCELVGKNGYCLWVRKEMLIIDPIIDPMFDSSIPAAQREYITL